MVVKSNIKEKAVSMRKEGKTYSEILKVVPVAKSTLSLWFHDVGLAEHQKQRITEKRIEGQKRGAAARRTQRIKSQNEIWAGAQKEIGKLNKRELWLIGIALYWAEGSKERDWRPGERVIFSNSDPRMIRVFLLWIKTFRQSNDKPVSFEIYIHESKKGILPEVIKFWAEETGFSESDFNKVYFKKNKVNTKRKNVGLLYNGVLRVKIPASVTLLRKMEGWARGIDEYCRIV